MFEKNKHNSKGNSFWLKMIDTKTSIVLTYIKEEKLIDFRLFNNKTIYEKSFNINIDNLVYDGDLSEDGNEYDLKINNSVFIFNFYYSLNNNLVISIIENGKRQELTTIPSILLN